MKVSGDVALFHDERGRCRVLIPASTIVMTTTNGGCPLIHLTVSRGDLERLDSILGDFLDDEVLAEEVRHG
jgi:hypothetical protein